MLERVAERFRRMMRPADANEEMREQALERLVGQERRQRQEAALAELAESRTAHTARGAELARLREDEHSRISASAAALERAHIEHDRLRVEAAERLQAAGLAELSAELRVARAERVLLELADPAIYELCRSLQDALAAVGHERPQTFHQTERVLGGSRWPDRVVEAVADFGPRDAKVARLRAALADAEALRVRALPHDALREELRAIRERAGVAA